MPLTDTAIRNAKPTAKAQRLFDGGGLYLEISPAGGKWWRLKYRVAGKEKRISLGTYPSTSLKVARERRDAARQLLASGADPSIERKAEKLQQVPQTGSTFQEVAKSWLAHQAGRWAAATKAKALASFEADVFPSLGAMQLGDIRARHVIQVVRVVEARGANETAGRVLQRIRSVFRYAVREEILETNPMADVRPEEVLKARKVQHRAALPETELPAFLTVLASYQGYAATAQALKLLMLTAVRPGELRGAKWSEIDLNAGRWRIPAERMKMKIEHLVPLSTQAVALLQSLGPGKGESLVFPSPYYPDMPLSENTLNKALARMGYKGVATAHGFRALFSTVANEAGHNPDVIERQLAHIERNEVRAAYHRSTYVDDRTKLMQWWADYLDGKQRGMPATTP